MFEKFHRGDIYSADLSPGIGSEQSGSRPVLILQNNVGNCFSPTIIIAAITSVSKKSRKFPTHYHLNDRCGLVKPSVVMLEQIRTIDKSRLKNYIGHLNKDDMEFKILYNVSTHISFTTPLWSLNIVPSSE